MMLFTISQFSKMSGFSTRNIRLYEEYGVIEAKRGDNNYRYYTLEDAFRIGDFRYFRGLGFSIAQSKDLAHSCKPDNFIDAIRSRQNYLKEELSTLGKHLDVLINLEEEIKFALNNLNIFLKITYPNQLFLQSSNNTDFSITKENSQEISKWMDLLPVTQYALTININDTPDDNNKIYGNYGHVISVEEAEKHKLDNYSKYETLSMEDCLVFYTKSSWESGLYKESLSDLFDFLNNNRLEIRGPMLLIPFFICRTEKQPHSLVKCIVPITSS